MNINSINNSGDWNTFNQNIGGRTVGDIFDQGELAQEWCHKKRVRDNAFSARMKRSSVEIIVAFGLLVICFLAAKASGDFDSVDAILNLVRDALAGSILPLVRTILIGVGGLVGLCFAASGAGRFCHRSPGERRNQADMLLIDQRAEDLGFKKKEWNRAKRQQKGVN